jgi:hypothetical protein
MRCVVINGSGFVVDVNPQPEITTSCTMVLASPSELGPLGGMELSNAEGGQIALAIVGIWTLAYGFRLIASSININSESEKS